jgi:hypothetical protein
MQGRFHLYKAYASAAAFDKHLQAQHVHNFIATAPAHGAGTAHRQAALHSSLAADSKRRSVRGGRAAGFRLGPQRPGRRARPALLGTPARARHAHRGHRQHAERAGHARVSARGPEMRPRCSSRSASSAALTPTPSPQPPATSRSSRAIGATGSSCVVVRFPQVGQQARSGGDPVQLLPGQSAGGRQVQRGELRQPPVVTRRLLGRDRSLSLSQALVITTICVH